MKFYLSALAWTAAIAAASTGFADSTADQPAVTRGASQDASSLEIQPTPGMWLYTQERERYENPKAAVRRKAEFRAQQRQQRIALTKAMGMSKQRPLITNTSFYTYYRVYTPHGWLTVPGHYPPPVENFYLR